MTKIKITIKLIAYQLVGFGLLIFLIVGDELFDIPHNVFGSIATPINWSEALLEGSYILILSSFTMYLSLRLMKMIKYLEGFLPICAHCKKIRVEEEWIQIEDFISRHSAAEFTHGLCPECVEKHYGDIMRKKTK